MKTRSRMRKALRRIGGAVLMAVALYAMLAAPGLLSDQASTTPAHLHEARR